MPQAPNSVSDLSVLVDEISYAVRNILEILDTDDEVVTLKDKSFNDFLQLRLERLSNCKVIMQRDHLKCVFVGRTSNGKSSIINALMKNSILPMGIGHTTNCFITICTKDIEDSYIEHFLESDQITPIAVYPLDKLKSLTHAMSPIKVNANDTIKIDYPISLTKIFDGKVKLVDSPGLDIDNNYDEWIDKYCLDADMFVLVTNAESTLNLCERRFFIRVKEKFNIPNILIVNNRWDSTLEYDVEEINKVKIQQMNIFRDFLVKDLNVCQNNQVESRIFFVSALEELKSMKDPDSLIGIRGRRERAEDFKRLEETLKENLSEKALKNKIAPNFKALYQTFEELNSFTNCMFNAIIIEKEFLRKTVSKRNILSKNIESDMTRIHQKAANYIEHIVTKARDKISYDFQNLICSLETVIDKVKVEFDPFSRKDYLAYQKIVVENFENFLYQDLNAKTMTVINSQLKTGVDRLTKIYTELILSRPNDPNVSQCLAIACQPPLVDLYPDFSVIMNAKIQSLRSKISPIPIVFLSCEECTTYLNALDNRFNAYGKTHVNDLVLVGASAAPTSTNKLPEITLMIPKFSAVILSDFFFIPGFRFSLSPTSLSFLNSQWSQSRCPISTKIKAVSLNCVLYVCCFGLVTYGVISYNGRFWKHGLGFLIGMYGVIYVAERYSWNRNSEMMSLKYQFTAHCKQRMETIIHISAVTTARQLGSFLHLDLKGLQLGVEKITRDFYQQVDDINMLESKVLVQEKKFKKLKSHFYLIGQQMSAFKKEILIAST